jgi:hypothetical protein
MLETFGVSMAPTTVPVVYRVIRIAKNFFTIQLEHGYTQRISRVTLKSMDPLREIFDFYPLTKEREVLIDNRRRNMTYFKDLRWFLKDLRETPTSPDQQCALQAFKKLLA